MLLNQINQVEQRIINLKRSMNAELDSLLSQIQHLKELAAIANPDEPVRSESRKEQAVENEPSRWDHIPDVLKVKDIKDILKIGRNQAYDLVSSGQFYCIKIGRKYLIPKQGFIEWLEGEQ